MTRGYTNRPALVCCPTPIGEVVWARTNRNALLSLPTNTHTHTHTLTSVVIHGLSYIFRQLCDMPV